MPATPRPSAHQLRFDLRHARHGACRRPRQPGAQCSGAFTYTVNDNDAAVQALRQSTNTLTDAFSYTMRDAAGATKLLGSQSH
jgi:hypothetical protein